MRKSGRIPA
jgi:TPR repeat protein